MAVNLFATSHDPAEAAAWLDDARVVNQTRETAQLLSAALADRGLPAPYRPTHLHHPITRWVLAGDDQFLWTLDHLEALAHEHHRRFPSSQWHRSFELHRFAIDACRHLPRGDRSAMAMQNSARNESLGLDFTHLEVTHAYRAYLACRWRMASRRPRWTYAGPPWWLPTDPSTTP